MLFIIELLMQILVIMLLVSLIAGVVLVMFAMTYMVFTDRED